MKKIKLFLGVIAILALTGFLVMACGGGGSVDSDEDGGSPKNGWNGKPGTGGSGVDSDASTSITGKEAIEAYFDGGSSGTGLVKYKPANTDGANTGAYYEVQSDLTIYDNVKFDEFVKFSGNTTITASAGSTTVFKNGFAANDGDLTIDGDSTVEIDGVSEIGIGKTLTIKNSSSGTDVVKPTITGDGTINVNGNIVIELDELEPSSAMLFDHTLVFTANSKLSCTAGSGYGITFPEFVLIGTGGDFVIGSGGSITVEEDTFKINKGATVAGGFTAGSSGDQFEGFQLVRTWFDIEVKADGILTVGTVSTPTLLVIQPDFILTIKEASGNASPGTLIVSTTNTSSVNTIVNKGTFINDGTVSNSGAIYKGFTSGTQGVFRGDGIYDDNSGVGTPGTSLSSVGTSSSADDPRH